MIKKYFDLKRINKQLATGTNSGESFGRRKFMKAMGLGAIAWNPMLDSITSLASKPFEISYARNNFKVWRRGEVAWTIPKNLFENGMSVKYRVEGDEHLIKVKHLNYLHSNLSLDFNARIYSDSGIWKMDITFSSLGFKESVNFINFLDGLENVGAKFHLQSNIIQPHQTHSISVDGNINFSLSNSWELLLRGKNKIICDDNGKNYYTDALRIQAPDKACIGMLRKLPISGIQIILPEEKNWSEFVSRLSYKTESQLLVDSDKPDINYILGKTKNNSELKVKWLTHQNGNLRIQTGEKGEGFSFKNYIFLAEFNGLEQPEFYLSGKLNGEHHWLSNALGAFGFAADPEEPEFLASGYGNTIRKQILEPRLRAFKPVITDAVTLTSYYQDPVKVRLSTQKKSSTTQEKTKKATLNLRNVKLPSNNSTRVPERETPRTDDESTRSPQQPIRNISIQKPVKVDKKTPNLTLEFDRVKFKPKKAIRIKLLRPEDMVFLEFEFHNFNFTNKGEAPYLELDNDKKKGVVVVYFPTQHTLEEAFFESNQIPGTGTNTEVKLPARHLRAKRSRLVYELLEGHEGFPLILDELLNWSKFELRVHPRAWIKLPQLVKYRSQKYTQSKTTIPNPSSKYLDGPSKDYSIKLSDNTKVKAERNTIYAENEISKVLQPARVNTLKASFNVKSIKKISWKVEPIPDLSTSIEAPTLMYISPNQVNDFFHKTALELRDVDEQKKVQQKMDSDLRVYDPLLTTKGEVAELWHTKLGVKLKDGKTSGTALKDLKTIRALWAYDAQSSYEGMGVINAPFMASLDAKDRQILVHTTSNYSIKDYYPEPVPVKRLMLSNLGAYLDWHAFFDVPSPADNTLNIIEWEHLATLGRDHFVKVVYEGYLFPFGHRAALVKITERKFHKPTKAAVNRQRMYIVVLEKEVLYARNNPEGDFIEFPFQAVRIENSSTPDIDNPAGSTLINVSGNSGLKKKTLSRISSGEGNSAYNFFINVANEGFKFDLTLTDKEGDEHIVRMPLVFLENFVARDKTQANRIINEYQKEKHKAYYEVDIFGQDIAYAESFVDGDTAFETDNLWFGGVNYPAKGKSDIKFHPCMRLANVYIKPLNEITGVRDVTEITLEDDNNDGQVFAKVKEAVLDFSGGSDKAGGFLSPNMGITALSKLQGPVGGSIDNIKAMQFNPDDFFAALDNFPVAKIFGVIDIFDLLLGGMDLGGSFDGVINAVNSIKKELEELKNEILFLENQAAETMQDLENEISNKKQQLANKANEMLDALNSNVPKIPNFKTYVTESAFYAEYKWQPEFKSNPIVIVSNLLQVNVDSPTDALTISTKLEKPFDADKPALMAGSARFENFGIDIVPLLAVNFNYLEFKMGSSEKTDVKVEMNPNNPIEFKGVLNFVNNLQSIIPNTGFSDDGPYVDISPTGVKAGFDISIPNVEVGICMISNISLGASVTLPFTGAPLAIGFNFCRRENPFLLTISCFGGGGYFMMVTTLDGIQSIEAAFEFGAALSLNVGVASGGVSAMGGFYYKMEIIEEERTTTLTGYLRINGHLSILGLINLSMEFYLAFSAIIVEGKVQKLEGVATVKVKVEVLFFSKTVSVTVRRELKGADADPKFIEMIEPDDWQEYCLAFAG